MLKFSLDDPLIYYGLVLNIIDIGEYSEGLVGMGMRGGKRKGKGLSTIVEIVE